jgi:hypothetical protein
MLLGKNYGHYGSIMEFADLRFKLRNCRHVTLQLQLLNILILASLLYSLELGYPCLRAADIRTLFCTDNRR